MEHRAAYLREPTRGLAPKPEALLPQDSPWLSWSGDLPVALFFAVNGAKQGLTEEHKPPPAQARQKRNASWTNGLPEPLGTRKLER